MRFFTAALLAVSALSSAVLGAPQATTTATSPPAPAPTTGGQSPNPISYPTAGTECEAGKPCNIKWTPDKSKVVKLKLRGGDSSDLDVIEVISDGAPNTGEFPWTPSKNLKPGSTYSIEIINEQGISNYSPQFTINSNGSGLSSTTTKTTSSAASTTSTTSTTASTSSTTTTTNRSSSATVASTATTNGTYTTTSASKTVKSTSTSTSTNEAPNPNGTGAANGLLSAHSPLALILCVGAAMAYLS